MRLAPFAILGPLWIALGAGCGGQSAAEPHDEAPERRDHDGSGPPLPATPASATRADDHDDAAADNLDPDEIEKRVCEHDLRTIDCDECRYELGVVKVDPAITSALTKTTAVREGDAKRTLLLTGEVRYDQTMLVEVLPAAAGRVVSVKARLGERVEAGALLAIVHSGDFGEVKAAYLEAQAAAAVAYLEQNRQTAITAGLEKLLAAATNEPGSDVPAETLGEWKSKVVGAVARLRQAQTVLEREKSLVAKQASSRAELESAERELQTALADYVALLEETQLNVTLDGLRAESAARLTNVKLNAAHQRLSVFGLDDEAIKAIPQMTNAGQFAQLEVRAPRAGFITTQNISEGSFVEPSQSLYTIADTSNVWVWCDLYERDLGPLHDRLAKGEKPGAAVTVTAFSASFVGAVDLLDSTVDESTRTIKVRVQVRNEEGKLRPGMFATVEIPLPEGRKVGLVPRQAVLSDEAQSFAFVHWRDNLWLRRNVTLGRLQGDLVEVLGGLSVGDEVVVSGGFLFKSDVLRAKMGAGCAD
ncbi:MAG: efflux RND transporter periplasmic adaptor subunit [Gemmatimonadaceae bacterium]|nr:efflux RND transporter periplasmic adaptor subunit [Gemmatimonadaceae bacterium]